MIAVPSMLIVAPSGIVNDATELLAPNFLVAVSSVIGMVALELDVLKANKHVCFIFAKKVVGFKPVKSFNNKV